MDTFPAQQEETEKLALQENLNQDLKRALKFALAGDFTLSFKIMATLSLDSLNSTELFSFHDWMASFSFLRGDLEKCFWHLQQLLDTNIPSSNTFVKLALVHLENSNINEAVQILEKTEKMSLQNPSFYCYRGDILALSGNLIAAIEDFNHALKLKNDFVIVMCRKARCLVNLNRSLEAGKYINDCLIKFPEDPLLLHCLAEICVLTGDNDRFQDLINDLMKKEPLFPSSYYTKALALIKDSKHSDEAERLLEKALSVDPLFVDARIQLAHLLAMKGQVENAGREYDLATINSRTHLEALSISKLKIATLAQVEVTKKYPELEARFEYSNNPPFISNILTFF